jgi:hypothetical protein
VNESPGVQTCYSPCSFTVDDGQTHQVLVADYGTEMFSHWSDDLGYPCAWGGLYPVTISEGNTATVTLTAVYDP